MANGIRDIRDIKAFKLNSAFVAGVIVEKKKLTKGYYGQSSDKFFLKMTVSDTPNNKIGLLFQEDEAVYVSKYFKESDFISVTGHIERNDWSKETYVRVTQVAFPIKSHIEMIKEEIEEMKKDKSIEDMLEESENDLR